MAPYANSITYRMVYRRDVARKTPKEIQHQSFAFFDESAALVWSPDCSLPLTWEEKTRATMLKGRLNILQQRVLKMVSKIA